MAACDITTQIAASACRVAPVLSHYKQKQFLIFTYWLAAIVEGASVSSTSIRDLIGEAACWKSAEHSNLMAFEIQSVINAYNRLLGTTNEYPYTDEQIRDAIACLDGTPEADLDYILGYIRCQMLSNLPDIAD